MTFVIRLEDIVLDPKRTEDLNALSEDEAKTLIQQHYGFLAPDVSVEINDGVASITFESSEKTLAAEADYRKASDLARKGHYRKAIESFRRAVENNPAHIEARRDLAMALYERGDVEEAIEQLVMVLRQEPANIWALVLVANIYLDKKQDRETAERYYLTALAHDPDELYVISNYAALLAKTGREDDAQEYFQKALNIDPDYPNSYYGLALLYHNQNKYIESLDVLDKMFERPKSADVRREPVYKEAQSLFARTNVILARDDEEKALDVVRDLSLEVPRLSGISVVFEKDSSLTFPEAKTELAWVHGRQRHCIRYKEVSASFLVPHLLAHELQHIIMEAEAHKRDRGKSFCTNAATQNNARKTMGSFLAKIKKKGIFSEKLDDYLEFIIEGLCSQLFNIPVDLLIERRLYDTHPDLRGSQFASLHKQMQMNQQVISDPKYTENVPPIVAKANIAMNCAYALFADNLYKNKTEYAAPYRLESSYSVGRKLFQAYESAAASFMPGDEYDLVDEFAKILKLRLWYDWLPGRYCPSHTEQRAPEQTGEQTRSDYATNQELLDNKGPATIMFCLDALQLFENMDEGEVRKIAHEIAIRGMDGLDYASADQKYTLQSLPGRKFSGLHLMALMYVGFKQIAPDQDIGIPFENEYQQALVFHRRKP